MLANAARLSRALAATLDALLSGLALEVQSEALLLVTQYPLPASAGNWADGFWQIVSIKENKQLNTVRFRAACSFRGLFYFATRRSEVLRNVR